MDCESSQKSTESGKGSSECQETEQDSDGIWSTASENKSDPESDIISSDSISHELLTVRDKTGLNSHGGTASDIQQLISDAESLALERSQSQAGSSRLSSTLKHSGFVSPSLGDFNPEEKTIDGSSNGSTALKQSSFENDDSGYYGRGNVKEIPEASGPNKNYQYATSSQVFPSKLISSGTTKQASQFPRRDSISSKFVSSEGQSLEHPTVNISWDGKSDTTSNGFSATYPLVQTSMQNARGGFDVESSFRRNISEGCNHSTEEKVSFTKDVKEVCNSSIKECHETSEGSPPSQKFHLTVSSTPTDSSQSNRPGSKEVSSLVHNECSNLLRLALTSTSSLGRVIRLVRQLMTLQFGMETPTVAKSVRHEVEEFEKQHLSLQSQLSSEASQLQATLGQVQALESCLFELQSEHATVDKIASAILPQVEESLSKCGLQHMIAVTSPRRRNVGRIMEDIESALGLLLRELTQRSNHSRNLENDLQCLRQEREAMQKSLTDKASSLLSASRELERNKTWCNSEVSSLKQCLAQAEANIAEIRLEKERLVETNKRQGQEDKLAFKKLQKQLLDAQHSSDVRSSRLENCLQEVTKEKLHLEASFIDLKNQFCVQEQQSNLMNEEHLLLVEGLRSTIKHQQSDGEKLRMMLEQATNEKQNALRQSEESSKEFANMLELYEKLQIEASSLSDKIRDLVQDKKDCEVALQNKIDTLTGVRHDLERQLRTRDLSILHLQTELRLDATQINALREDNNNLIQKAQNLQERLWEASRRRRRQGSGGSRVSEDYGFVTRTPSETGSVLSLIASSEEAGPTNQRVKSLEKDINDGQSREEHLHKLLSEKDEAIKNLQNSLSTELAAKNQELEVLRNKLPELEEQMGSLLSAIEVNEAMGQVTTEVGRRLQERHEYLENLDRSSNILQDEYTTLAVENHTLKSELAEYKRTNSKHLGETSESARRAKEEARRERLNSARLEEQCSKLQAELRCTSTLLEQERREKEMRDMVQQFKHEDFGAVLNSTLSSGLDSL